MRPYIREKSFFDLKTHSYRPFSCLSDRARKFSTKRRRPKSVWSIPIQFRMSLLWYILGYWLYWSLTPVSHDNKFLFICFNVYEKRVDKDAYVIIFRLFSKICGSDWLKYNITLYLVLPTKHSIIIFQSIDHFLHSKILITNVVGYKNALFRYLKVNNFFFHF